MIASQAQSNEEGSSSLNQLPSRPPTKSEYLQLIEFLDKALRPNCAWSITNEYPTALNIESLHNMRFIFDGKEIYSHAVLKPHILKTPQLILKVGAVGSVVTNEKYRNLGFSHKVLSDCLENAKDQDCEIAILWTNLFEFYKKIGFSVCGYEMGIIIGENFNASISPGSKILKTNQVDPNALLRIMNQHSVITSRSIEDLKKFLQIPNSRVYTLWEANGSLSAYAIEGKGADLGGYIHEWGGPVSKLLELFKFIQQDQKKDITIISPKHSINLIESCKKNGAYVNEGVLGMVKILDEEGLFKKIIRHARTDLGISNLVLEKIPKKSNVQNVLSNKSVKNLKTKDSNLETQDPSNLDEYRIGTTDQHLTTNEPGDIASLIFGPNLFSSLDGFDRNTQDTLKKIFPLPLWLWGWDSV